jgi:hypothetical protein
MSATTAPIVVDPLAKLVELHERQQEWDDKFYRNTTDKLLAILADCLDVYVRLRGTHMLQARRKLHRELERLHLASRDHVDLAVKVCRFVFHVNGGRTAAYARVIRIAVEEDQTRTTFADWVREQGGIEDVRLNRKTNGQTPTEQAEAVSDMLEAFAGLAQLDKIVDELKPTDDATYPYALALVRYNATLGKQEVVLGNNNASLVRMFLLKVEEAVRKQAASMREKTAQEAQRAAEETALAKAKLIVAPMAFPSGTVVPGNVTFKTSNAGYHATAG